MNVIVSGDGCFGEWCYFEGKFTMKAFKVKQLKIKISGIIFNLTSVSFRQNLSNKEVLQ
jgi:hypothetical protein